MSIATAAVVAGAGASIYGAVSGGGGASGPYATTSPTETAAQILQDQINEAPSVLALTQQQAPQYAGLENQILYQTLFGNGSGTGQTGTGNQYSMPSSSGGVMAPAGINGLSDQSQSSAQNGGLLGLYGAAAPQFQTLQNQLNAQQAGANVGLVNNLGLQATQAFQNANPQLAALQAQYSQMANTPQNPVGQISGGGWATQFNNQVQQQVAGAQVNPQSIQGANLGFQVQAPLGVGVGGNPTLNQLNQTAQQQLALGTSVSPQQQATLANEVMSNYNQMGRANDPIAIAGLATGLDTYGQQLLGQREANAATAANLTQGQQGLGLTAQQSNQAAQLQAQGLGLQAAGTQAGYTQQANIANQSTNLAAQQTNLSALLSALGLQGSSLNASGSQQLQASEANQQAQLANAQYQAELMQQAAGLLTATSVNPFATILGQSGAIGTSMGAASQGSGVAAGGQGLSGTYNPFNAPGFSNIFNTQSQQGQFNANTNQGIMGAGMNLLGSGLGSMMG